MYEAVAGLSLMFHMNPTYTQPYTRNWGEKRGTTWWSFGNYLIKRPDGGEAYMVLLCSVMSFDSVYTSKPIWQVCGLTAAPSLLPGSAAPSADESLWLCLVKSQIFSQWWGWGCISLSGGTILTFWRVEKVRFISYKNKKKIHWEIQMILSLLFLVPSFNNSLKSLCSQ